MKKLLSNIYRATQCVDINDVEYAISETRKVIKLFPDNKAPIRRLVSLLKRKDELSC